jgi:hypothetical protein
VISSMASIILRPSMRVKITLDNMVPIFSIDGAQLYRNKASDCWIYILVVLNLPYHNAAQLDTSLPDSAPHTHLHAHTHQPMHIRTHTPACSLVCPSSLYL